MSLTLSIPLMLLNRATREDSWESLGLQGHQTTPVNSKGNQPWIFIDSIDAEAPILWPLDVKSQLIKKDPDAGKDWRHSLRALPETNSTSIQKCNHILRLEKYPFCSFKLWQRVLFSSVRLKDLGAGMGLSLPRYTVVPWWTWKQSSVSYRVWHVVNECLLWSE